jgi:23S rRNA pseudouridine2605 synthase
VRQRRSRPASTAAAPPGYNRAVASSGGAGRAGGAGGAGRAVRHSIIRILSKKGLCSRKQAVELVAAGRVRLNGRLVERPGELASLADRVEVDGEPLAGRTRVYLMLHKPAGCVTTRSDERGRDTVYRWLEGVSEWVAPVGRLDKESEGLLLFTNDSRFSDRLLDPRNAVPRTYLVTVDGALSAGELAGVLRGTDIGRGDVSKPSAIRLAPAGGGAATYEVTLTEGKNREIRRLFEAYQKKVVRLVRVRFGPFALGTLESGRWRPLTAAEAALVTGPR